MGGTRLALADERGSGGVAVQSSPRDKLPPGRRAFLGLQTWILLAVVALYVAARLWSLAAICLDGDEIFSVGVARQSWRALTSAVAADSIHPPLFYYLLKIWMLIGNDSLFWVRLLPALFSMLSILPMILLGRQLRLRPLEINCAIGLTAIHPFLIYYSQHTRMYSLLLLCGLTSLWLFHRAINPRTRGVGPAYVALTLGNVVLVYSHYYGWLIVGLECLYVLLWRRAQWKQAFLSAAAVVVASTPWIYTAAMRAIAKGGLGKNLEWIQKPSFRDLAWLFVDLSGFGEFPNMGLRALASITLLLVLAMWIQWRRRHARSFGHVLHFLLFFTLGPVAIAFAASRLLPSSVWGHRHLIFAAVTLFLLTAVAYCRLRSRAIRLVGLVLCAGWAIGVAHHQLKGDDKKTPVDTLVVEMLNREDATSGPIPFFAVDRYFHYPVWFYLETLKARRITGLAVHLSDHDRDVLAAKAALIKVKANASIDDVRGAHFWLGTSSYSWKQKVSPGELMTQRGCRVGRELRVGDRYHTVAAIPVWCDAADRD